GVCYLEMARAAVEKESSEAEEGATILLKKVVWAQPIVVGVDTWEVHIGLFEGKSGQIRYEVYTESDNEEGTVVHSQGVAEVKTKEETTSIDIEELKTQMSEGTLNAEICYQAFKEMGIDYGEGNRGIRGIYKGLNQILAKLSLPSSVQDTKAQYVLHPSLMDAALQSTIGLILDNDALKDGNVEQLKPSLPFALESLEILASCTSEMYAWVRYSVGRAHSEKAQKHDIDLCDEQGNVCVMIRGFSTRVLGSEFGALETKDSIGTLLATQVWKETAMLSSVTQQEYREHLVLLCEMRRDMAKELQSLILESKCLNLKSNQDQIESRFTEYAVRCFEMIREIFKKKPLEKVLVQIFVPNAQERSLFAGLSGLLKTAALENPKIIGQLIEINPEETLDGLLGIVKENSRCPQDSHIRYKEHKRLTFSWSEVDVRAGLKPALRLPWKDRGVYLITGGAGGLGTLFTREILRKAKVAKIILTGRSELSPKRQLVLRELQARGGKVEYQKVDVSNLKQVNSLIETIQDKYGKLGGIIHSAGVVLDNFILNKTTEEFRKVLLPKVTGTVHLDKATQGIALDFFVLFSSGTGALGNIGQADYATANAFMDQFATYRNRLVDGNERKGQTLSINWPLWKAGGMQLDPAYQERMFEQTGMKSLPTQEGVDIVSHLDDFLKHSQLLVAYGNRAKIHREVLNMKVSIQQTEKVFSSAISMSDVHPSSSLETYLRSLFGSELKVSPEAMDGETEFSDYGADSIVMMSILTRLEERFHRSFSPTLIAEYNSLAKLNQYLSEEGFLIAKQEIPRESTSSVSTLESVHVSGKVTAVPPTHSRRRRKKNRYSSSMDTTSGKIAVISQSCRLPCANTVEEFWKNLAEGLNCVAESPLDGRWDPDEFYHPEIQPGKTYTNHGGFMQGIECFDADFFGIKDEEAICMDPQHRILLELSQELFDQSGYSKEEIDGSTTGIFIGAKENLYLRNYYYQIPQESFQHSVVNSIANMMAARISDYFNLKGASKTIDTACSSSLVAIHDACQSILLGESTMAIAGGIYLMIDAFSHVSFSQAKVLSRDGKTYVFDERAQGFVMGEGAGLVLLKDYEAALQAGDQIKAVILGSAVNNDGHTMGLTVPNQEGQKEVIQTALRKSQVDPATIGYLEAHGTGTLLGDPIEIRAVSQVYGQFTEKKQYCAVGSVKSNLGHTMTAAGVTGVLKVIASLQHQQIPATLHCQKPHPRFNFDSSPFYPNIELQNWNSIEGVRRAAISSFGFGGTNCHMILEEAPPGMENHPFPITRFQHKRYWLGKDIVPESGILHPAVDSSASSASETVWYRKAYAHNVPLLKDHLIFGEQVLMGVAHLSLFVDAAKRIRPDQDFTLKKVLFSNPLQVQESKTAQLQIKGKALRKNQCQLQSQYRKSQSGPFVQTAQGSLEFTDPWTQEKIDLVSMLESCTETYMGSQFYASPKQSCYGASLFSVAKVFRISPSKAIGEITLDALMQKEQNEYSLHPAIFDACHVIATFCGTSNLVLLTENHWPPLLVKEVQVKAKYLNYESTHFYAIVEEKLHNEQIAEFDIHLLSESGESLILLKGFTTKKVPNKAALFSKNESYQGEPLLPLQKVTPIHSEISSDYDFDTIENSANLQEQIQNFIQSIFAGSLQQSKSKVSVTKNFMDMGVDSNQMISLVQDLEKRVSIELYPTLFFEHQNIEAIAKYFASEHPSTWDQFFEKQRLSKAKASTTAGSKPTTLSQQQKNAASVYTVQGSLQSSVASSWSSRPSLRVRMSTQKNSEAIAIIGMSGYLPQSSNLQEFWKHISANRDLVTEIPENHWDYLPWFDSDKEADNKTYSKWGSFIGEIDQFDPLFFGISPRQADWMDPQLRLGLQSVYHTFEDAGVVNQIRGSNTGVYVGSCFHEYWDEIVRANTPMIDFQHSSSVMSSLSAFISYTFDLQGGSVPLDNACASSITALHLGCQAIKAGECEMAVIAGMNVLLSPMHYLYFSRMRALSPTGRCYSFDHKADGYVPGEGVVSVLIKPLFKALEDGDQIHAVIKGTAINHVGKSNNPNSPRPELQMQLLMDAWKNAGIDPESFSYMEAHGTGTKLGDPIEVNALTKAFQKHTKKTQFCALGSTKAHVGHLEGAAGLTSLIKVVLMMKHQEIPKMPNFEKLNPYISLEKSPFFINLENKPWKRIGEEPLRAGVSSFGMTGNNAHAVLEEYIVPEKIPSELIVYSSDVYCIPLSARTPKQINEVCLGLLGWIQDNFELKSVSSIKESSLLLQEIQATLVKLLSSIIHVPEESIEVSEIFKDYGVETVHQTGLLKQVQNQWNVELNSVSFLDQNSIEELTQHILENSPEILSVVSDDSVRQKNPTELSRDIIADLAYTLQIGREVMQERIGFLVSSLQELYEKLQAFIEGDVGIEGLYQGTSKQE
ncbi:MAG: SDR family NAD(P)-dependent oxidoreductase, partial [Planctomycetes bacterium]|nr:SDR family NAD(P)-dependent oxidoreductase [Planctomycetota bacterium]